MNWLDHHSGAVQALATTLLLVITAVYVFLTSRLATVAREANGLTREANELTRRAIVSQIEERERRQAGAVSAWLVPHYNTEQGSAVYFAEFRNHSQAPVFKMLFTMRFPTRGDVHNEERHVGEPGEDARIRFAVGAAPSLPDKPLLDFEFTDNAGVRWHRSPDGDLHKVGEGEQLRE